MAEREEFIFKINAFTPETIPMGRLAEYMHDLARLLGEPDNVHLVSVEPGCVQLRQFVEREAVPKVLARVTAVTHGGMAPQDAVRAAASLNKRLEADNTDAVFTRASGATIIAFPGIKAATIPQWAPVTELGTIDGVVRRVGGKREAPVPVSLQTQGGFEPHCFASRAMAKELSKFYDGPIIRCAGKGTWERAAESGWTLQKFLITDFEELGQQTLPEALADLQSLPHGDWGDVRANLDSIRGDDE